MKKEIADQWVAALRSGKYQQTTGMLRDDLGVGKPVGFCCLGVLCDITQLGQWRFVPVTRSDSEIGRWDYVITEHDQESHVLPQFVQHIAGMESAQGQVGDMTLTELNDGGASFKEIADYIEENWKSL